MAFLLKNRVSNSVTGPAGNGYATLSQYTHIKRGALLLPATGTEQLFRVHGGRVLVRLMVGTVTVVLDSTDPVAKITSAALNAAEDTVVGTAVDVASTVSLASLEVGGTALVEGDGTALVKANAGAVFLGASGEVGPWIAPAGEIYLTTGGTNLTGFMQWDLWYQPLDEGAYVTAVGVATAKI